MTESAHEARPGARTRQTQERWARVTEIVDGALQRPDPRERRAFLKDACAGDGDLRREVEGLLRFEAVDGAWLPEDERLPEEAFQDRGAGQDPDPDDATTELRPVEEDGLAPGDTVGPYRVESVLGAGGMGRVFLAFEPSLERHVALKVIRRDKVSPELIRRFELERRILARLEHPHIARIFGTGRHRGLPFFVMERVRGRPIDQWCDGRRAGVEQRLGLVVQVCEALDEAHRNLVVHRDLKPSNVWVDEDGRPKILDFGIAKDLGPAGEAGQTTVNQPLSLPFAAPEQVRNRPVSVATDVYGLGVLLYELLCGHPPYLLDGDVFENVRTICEHLPDPPSRRATLNREVWRGGSPHTVAPEETAARRGTEPRKLRRRLQGDLDAVVLKALAKDPAERYRTAADLADEIRRHLEGRPVAARGGGRLYRWGKFLRRRRGALLGLGAVLWSLIGVHLWLDGERRTRDAELQAQTAAREALEADREAEAVTAFARNLVLAADPDASGRRLSVADMMARAESEARRVLSDQPTSLAHQLEAMGLVLQSRAAYDPARPLLREALDLRTAAYDGDHRLVARSLNNLATLDQQRGDRAAAETGYRAALAMKTRLGQAPEETAKVRANLASLLVFRGAYDEAEPLLLGMLHDLEGRASVRRPPVRRAELAAVHRGLANLYYLSRRPEEAEPHAVRAHALRLELFGEHSLKTATTLSLLGRIQQARGALDDAENSFRQVLAIRRRHLQSDHVLIALADKDLAALYFELGEPDVARIHWRRAHTVLARESPDGWELDDLWRLWALQRPDAPTCLDDTRSRLGQVRGAESVFAARP